MGPAGPLAGAPHDRPALRSTARRIQLLAAEADQLPAELTVLVQAAAPGCWRRPASAP
jgi:hypothetical protein